MEKARQSVKLSDQAYQHAVDNALNKQSDNLNAVMKALTVLTVTFIPFNVISGFFGMNVQVPFQGDLFESYIPFITIVGASCFLSMLAIFIFKRLKWL